MDFRRVIPSAIKPPLYIETMGFLRTFIEAVFKYFLVFEGTPTREEIAAAVDHVNEVLLWTSGYGIENLKPPDPMDKVEGQTPKDEDKDEGQNSDSDDWSDEAEEEKVQLVETSELARAIVFNRPRYGGGDKLERKKFKFDISGYERSDWDATMEGLTHGALGNAILAQALQDLFIRSLASGDWPIINLHFDFSDKLKRILDLSGQPELMNRFLDVTTNSEFVAGMKRFLQQPVAAEGLSFAGDVFLVWGLPSHTAYTLREGVPSVTVAEKIRAFLNPSPVRRKRRKLGAPVKA